ncbi:hypothetical protein UJ101_00537 [Flavobacteriaceae bacterium UJ101]|nr:hypothetical protein UJ101_00537 [Flavobacteriaceae bacterium UJ101]
MERNKLYEFDQSLVKLIIYMYSFYPIIPNFFKGLLIIPILLSILIRLIIKDFKFDYTKFSFFVLPLLISCFGLFFTDDFKYGLRIIEKYSAFLIFGLFLFNINSYSFNYSKIIRQFINNYIYSSTLFSLLLGSYFVYLLYISKSASTVYDCIYSMTHDLSFYNHHPIYISLIIGVGILFSCYKIFYTKRISFFFLSLFSITIQLTIVIILARKGILISLFIAIIILFVFLAKNNLKIMILLLTLFITSISVAILNSITFKERTYNFIIELNENNQRLNINNSTSVRLLLYKCSIEKIKRNFFWGYGTGDANNELKKCYSIHPGMENEKLNSHNQYFSFLLQTGVFGFLSIILLIIYFLFIARLNNDYIYITLLIYFSIAMLFENILERNIGIRLFCFIVAFFSCKRNIGRIFS